MQNRHRSGHDLATPRWQTASLHQVVSFAQFSQESGNFQKIIAAVGVTHDDEFAASGSDTSHQSVAVSFRENVDQTRSQLDSDFNRSVVAAVVQR